MLHIIILLFFYLNHFFLLHTKIFSFNVWNVKAQIINISNVQFFYGLEQMYESFFNLKKKCFVLVQKALYAHVTTFNLSTNIYLSYFSFFKNHIINNMFFEETVVCLYFFFLYFNIWSLRTHIINYKIITNLV